MKTPPKPHFLSKSNSRRRIYPDRGIQFLIKLEPIDLVEKYLNFNKYVILIGTFHCNSEKSIFYCFLKLDLTAIIHWNHEWAPTIQCGSSLFFFKKKKLNKIQNIYPSLRKRSLRLIQWMHPISGLPLQLRQESEQFRRETDFGQYHVALLVFSVQFFATKCPLAHKIGAQTNKERQNLSKFGPIEQRWTIEKNKIFFLN